MGNGTEELTYLRSATHRSARDADACREGACDHGGSPLLRLAEISKSFGGSCALHPVSLEFRAGDFFAVLGPSGCGKSTLLRIIGGFLKPSGGQIQIAGEDVTDLPPERRRTNMVFQGYGLFPHMTVRQNIAYGLKVAKREPDEIRRRTDSMVHLVHLDGLEERLPSTLSGGQQQRVALARALVMEPAVLLLDESLAALDLKLRRAMQEELRALHKSIGGTFVFVTHDQSEAMALATRIAVMRDGRIEQEGTPREVYLKPRTAFVASFVGDANVLAGRRSGGLISLDCGAKLPSPGPEGRVALMVRPNTVRWLQTGAMTTTADHPVSGRIEDIVFMGDHVRLTLVAAQGVRIQAHIENGSFPPAGSEATLSWNSTSQHVIEAPDV